MHNNVGGEVARLAEAAEAENFAPTKFNAFFMLCTYRTMPAYLLHTLDGLGGLGEASAIQEGTREGFWV